VSLGKEKGVGKISRLFRFYSLVWRYRAEYDVVLVHMNPIWVVLGGIPWHMMGKKVALWYTHKAVTWKLRMAVHGADVIFTASPESFRIASPKVIVTGHGIDTTLFSPDAGTPRNDASLLTVGRIAPVKNLEVLVDAVSLLHQQDSALTVVIVGVPALRRDREYETAIRQRIAHAGLTDRFVFAGKHRNDQLLPFYRSCGVFVHMSRTGSLDKALLEAMACGARVVSSNDAAKAFLPRELTFDERDPASLAAAISSALERPADPALRAYVVQHHDLSVLIDRLSGILSHDSH
jgi:glycosyltransferase involved in cell wall biosynthesis